MYLGQRDIEAVVGNRQASFRGMRRISPIGVDVFISGLYVPRKDIPESAYALPKSQFIADYLRRADGGIEIDFGREVFADVKGLFSLPKWLAFDPASRSTAGRNSLRTMCSGVEGGLWQGFDAKKRGTPLLRLLSDGAPTYVREGYSTTQLHVRDRREESAPVSDDALRKLIDQDKFQLYREGRKLSSGELTFDNGVVLTLDDWIAIHDPRQRLAASRDQRGKFYDLMFKEGAHLPWSTFFIALTAEDLRIPAEYLGRITETPLARTDPLHWAAASGDLGSVPFTAHPNAWGIKDEGKVTLEICVRDLSGYVFTPGMPIAKFQLYPLRTPIEGNSPRYSGQQRLTLPTGLAT